MGRAPLIALGLVAGLALSLPAQVINYRDDSLKVAAAESAGVSLVHWVQSSPTPGAMEHSIYARNLSQRAIQVTSYEIYDCINLIGRACGVHAPGPRLKPGQTVRLIVIGFGPFERGNPSYQYKVNGVFVPTDSAVAGRSH